MQIIIVDLKVIIILHLNMMADYFNNTYVQSGNCCWCKIFRTSQLNTLFYQIVCVCVCVCKMHRTLRVFHIVRPIKSKSHLLCKSVDWQIEHKRTHTMRFLTWAKVTKTASTTTKTTMTLLAPVRKETERERAIKSKWSTLPYDA